MRYLQEFAGADRTRRSLTEPADTANRDEREQATGLPGSEGEPARAMCRGRRFAAGRVRRPRVKLGDGWQVPREMEVIQ